MKGFGAFRKLGVPYFGVFIIRILLFRVLFSGPLFSETPICLNEETTGSMYPYSMYLGLK